MKKREIAVSRPTPVEHADASPEVQAVVDDIKSLAGRRRTASGRIPSRERAFDHCRNIFA